MTGLIDTTPPDEQQRYQVRLDVGLDGARRIDLAPYLADRPFDRTGTVAAVHAAPAGADVGAGVADGTEAGAAAELIATGTELVVGSSLWEDYKWPAIAAAVAVTAIAAFVVLGKRH